LEENAGLIEKSTDELFQFHFGSIGSLFARLFMLSTFMFQFHFGSIGSGNLTAGEYVYLVSIPLWFDWKLTGFQLLT